MRIGIFGGSFDPVHTEHIQLAKTAVESLRLDKLIVMPAGIPPHKQGKRLAPPADRLEMCRLAFASLPNAEVSDYEIEKAGTSYTYLTCRHFAEKYPSATLFWLVGTDMFWDFFHWKEPEDILQHATLAVCRRSEDESSIPVRRKAFYKRFSRSFESIPYNGLPVSSTDIRTKIALSMPVSDCLTAQTERYIRERGLYADERIERGLAMETPTRAEHSRRVCLMAMRNASRLHIDAEKALLASALHDVAKNLSGSDPALFGFVPPENVPAPVLHQFAGAYVLERVFKIADDDTLNAVRYHTSGRAGMSDLEKLVFLCDMLEEGRSFEGVESLRAIFAQDIDACVYQALKRQVEYLTAGGKEIYPLTLQAYEYYKTQREEK